MPVQLLEYGVATNSANNPDGTTVQIPFPAVASGQLWRVDQVAVAVIQPALFQIYGGSPSVLLYDQVPAPTVLPVQGTDLSLYQNDEEGSSSYINMWADWDDQGSPLTILGGSQLTVVFLNVANVAQCLARVQYGLYQGTSGEPTPAAGTQPAPSIPVSI